MRVMRRFFFYGVSKMTRGCISSGLSFADVNILYIYVSASYCTLIFRLSQAFTVHNSLLMLVLESVILAAWRKLRVVLVVTLFGVNLNPWLSE